MKQAAATAAENYPRLGDRIRDSCLDLYDKLGPNGKPLMNDFTVLASIFAENTSTGKIFPIALTTGTKCCGQDLIYEAAGTIISDSHA